MKIQSVLTSLIAAATLACSAGTHAQERLTVWWNKGYYKAEDDALYEVIRKFETKTKVKVDLSLYATQDMIPKTVAALDSRNPPDIVYGDVLDYQVTAKWAYDGRLEDISDVLTPLKPGFAPNTVETTYLYNDTAKKRAHYAFPVKQAILHVQYWRDMLANAGLKESDIPTKWADYWNFWCNTAQSASRKATGNRVFGIGQPMGVDSADSMYSFLTFLDAYNVKLVDNEGKPLVDDPKVRAGMVAALKDYVSVYTRGCTPPSSTSWKDPDNNVAFHNKTTLMTHNNTISIVAKWLDDSTNATLTPEQRATAKKNYEENIATAGLPDKPDGSKMEYRTTVKAGMVFAESKNKARAKEFVALFLQEANLTQYVETSLGRWFPVTKAGQASPFWKADKHRQAVLNQYANGTIGFETMKNYRFTILNNENIWAKGMNRVVNDKVTPEKAVDEMIERIKIVAR